MPKKSATYGEYFISQDQNDTINIEVRQFDNVKASLRAIADEVGFSYDNKWNTRYLGSKLIDDLNRKRRIRVAITQANVIGKCQSRTALGMMNAYLTMYPNTTIIELREKFSKQSVCPDAGIADIFYTPDELEQAMTQEKSEGKSGWFSNGNALFMSDNEWLILDNKQSVGFNKMWTATSLTLLQKQMAKFGIYGEVGSVPKETPAGFIINYQLC